MMIIRKLLRTLCTYFLEPLKMNKYCHYVTAAQEMVITAEGQDLFGYFSYRA